MCTLCKILQLSGQTKYVRAWLKLNGQMPLLNGYSRSVSRALIQAAMAFGVHVNELALCNTPALVEHVQGSKHICSLSHYYQ
eukprot:7639-Heterococcus_DN1.PRE.3